MSGSGPAEHQWNCLNCRRLKLRCDRQCPCSRCIKGHRSCIFPTTGRVFRRAEARARSLQAGALQAGAQQAGLMGRIRRLEDVVDNLSSELENRLSRASHSGPLGHDDAWAAGANDPEYDTAPFTQDASIRGNGTQGPGHGLEPPYLQVRSGISRAEGSGGLYIGDRFWASLRQEVGHHTPTSCIRKLIAVGNKIKPVRETLDEPEKDKSNLDSSYKPSLLKSVRRSSFNSSSFVFNNGDGKETPDLQALSSQIHLIWQTFAQNVGPFLQILHMPSVMKTIQDCKGLIDALDPSMQPLMFAISMAAVSSLAKEEVRQPYPEESRTFLTYCCKVRVGFNRDKDEFIAQLRYGTEEALARADFINTTSLSVVQAFTIYLFVLRRCETTRYTWSLVGLLVRIAVSLGLHRDGSYFPGMSPFEAEIRRRLWWNICFIESRLEHNHAPEIGISEQSFDTREPTNVGDVDLDPEMTAPPTPREGFTDTTITIIRCDIWRLSQTMKSVNSTIGLRQYELDLYIEKKLETLCIFREKISARHLWQLERPIQFAMATMLRIHANKWELIISHLHQPHPERDVSDEKSFALAISIIQDAFEFRHGEASRRWAWLQRGQVLWQPLAIILRHICSRPWDSITEDVWRLVTRSLSLASEAVHADPLWQSLQQLITRAQRYREEQLKLHGRNCKSSFSEHRPTSPNLPASKRTAIPISQIVAMAETAGGSDSTALNTATLGPVEYTQRLNAGQALWLSAGCVDKSLGTKETADIIDASV